MRRSAFLHASVLVLFLLIGANAHAAQTTLSLSLTGNGDAVQLQIKSDARSRMTLDYTDSSDNSRTYAVGTTDEDGYLATNVSTSDIGVVPGSTVYVVSGTSGSQSANVTWPLASSAEPTFGIQSFSLPLGESGDIPISNPDEVSLTLESNSNASVASAELNGDQLNLTAHQSGSTVATVCVTGVPSICMNLTVNVGTQGQNGPSLALSQTNPVVVLNQTGMVYPSGASGALHVSSNSNPSVAQVNIEGGAIAIVGNEDGAATATVCDAANDCGTLLITVISPTNVSKTGPTPSRQSESLSVGQSATVLVADSGYLTATSDAKNVASTTLAYGTNVLIQGVGAGKATITICDNSSECAYVQVSVSAPAPTTVVNTAPVSIPAVSTPAVVFDTYLTLGSTGQEVTALQQILSKQGYLSAAPTGYYGALTENAVIAFQAAHGLSQLGVVGPATRLLLNGGESGRTTSLAANTSGYVFSNFLGVGSTGADVTALQQELTSLGMYAGPVTGYFGSLTQAAVEQFQTSKSVAPVGYVGPATRAALNNT